MILDDIKISLRVKYLNNFNKLESRLSFIEYDNAIKQATGGYCTLDLHKAHKDLIKYKELNTGISFVEYMIKQNLKKAEESKICI